ncbi:uncharacterized protein C8A04DRAFT_38375 [Dichotomopilus funicola]|uniref:Epoxide hydrolase N-terminal domain-containing protein n=1 Tax=Dichotomopilus funicola TaxID=1934379 RepID=A0AAN6V050_9PEZI|nr:hypothetical protein C8A04DRAFT_38375 [Dichotomopilus funicola]
MAERVTSPVADEVKPYRIHIPTKHLDLTRQKLELTRLPHEPSHLGSGAWAPKPIIEPLIDHWYTCSLSHTHSSSHPPPLPAWRLENYSWRATEAQLNTIPQFRTALTLPNHPAPIRIHFLHARGRQQPTNTTTPAPIPLLVIPPFPLPAISLAPLIPLFTKTAVSASDSALEEEEEDDEDEDEAEETAEVDEEAGEDTQTFHVVIPSFPGTAFSDSLPANLTTSTSSNNPIPTTATLFNSLMHRLGYTRYLVTTVGPSSPSSSFSSPGSAAIDERVARRLASAHADSCVGTHLIAPRLCAPRWRLEGIVVWVRWRIARVTRGGKGSGGYERGDFEALERSRKPDIGNGDREGGYGRIREVVADPNTLSYALCDSPVGMLAFVLKGLRDAAGTGGGVGFTKDELVTLASVMWLSGPEGMLRFWAAAAEAANRGDLEGEEGSGTKRIGKPKVAITVFTGGISKDKHEPTQPTAPTTTTTTPLSLWPTPTDLTHPPTPYHPPAWATPHYNVVHTQRIPGPSSGLLAFEQPDVILVGLKGLAKGLKWNEQQTQHSTIVGAAPLMGGGGVVPSGPVVGKNGSGGVVTGSPTGELEPVDDKGKGKEDELLVPPPKVGSTHDESPDTLVATPPWEKT